MGIGWRVSLRVRAKGTLLHRHHFSSIPQPQLAGVVPIRLDVTNPDDVAAAVDGREADADAFLELIVQGDDFRASFGLRSKRLFLCLLGNRLLESSRSTCSAPNHLFTPFSTIAGGASVS